MNLEILVYSCGDSKNINTWSNVPFCFTRELEQWGFLLHRVNIEPQPVLNKLFNACSFRLYQKLLKKKSCPVYARFFLHRWITKWKLYAAARKYPNAKLHLFLSYAFYNPYAPAPSVLWCDWPDATVIQRLGREPEWYERGFLAHERNVIQNADLVYSMFARCAEHMTADYGRKVLWLGKNVVNNRFDGNIEPEQYLAERLKSNHILFIGNHHYLGAAQQLVNSVLQLRKEGENIELHLIGLTAAQLQNSSEAGIVCHGYLHKDNPKENAEYYQLMRSAKALVNPASQWGAYSSVVEAMYWGLPVIVTPFEDFTAEFGEESDFGYYLRSAVDLSSLLKKMIHLSADKYAEFSRNAHQKVHDYTWKNYISIFLHSLSEHGIKLTDE